MPRVPSLQQIIDGERARSPITQQNISDAQIKRTIAVREAVKTPSWQAAHRAAAKKRSEDPVWKRQQTIKNRRLSQDPEWLKANRAGAAKRKQNPALRASLKQGAEKRMADPVWRRRNARANRKKAQDPNWLKNTRQASKKRAKDPDWIRNNCRPVKTPQGVFQKYTDAVTAHQKIHGGNRITIGIYMRRWIRNTGNKEYQYISWNQFDRYVKSTKRSEVV